MLENRKYIIIGAFCLVGLIYLSRLFYLQILDDSYSLESSNNSIKRVIEIPYRGQVYDRNGKLIVYNTPVYDLYVTPKQVRIPDTTAFCRMMEMTRAEFDSIMNLAKEYSPVKPSLFVRQLSKEDFARIQDALVDYRGFEPRMSSMRTYPARTLSNALGYVSEISKKQLENQEIPYYRQGDYIGHNGLEEQYEEVLRGRRGVKFVMQNVRGVAKGSFKNGLYDTAAVAGKNLYTGIDVEVQKYADSLMQNRIGSVIAVEPSTGEILVSVSAPTYDPNLLSSRHFSKNYVKLLRDPYKPLINRPIMASYRPGSTFKLIQALIAQQQGTLTPNMVYGHGGSPMRCHCHGGNNLRGAVRFSCNPYFYNVFRKMIYHNGDPNTFKASAIGLRQWHDAVEKFGIGQKLGVDLPTELKGSLPDVETYDKLYRGKNTWKFSNIYSLSIGEGELLVNPLKLVNLAATIANRGWYITPHYVKGIGRVGEGIPQEYLKRHETDIAYQHYLPVIEGMRMAVAAGTVNKMADIPGIDLCGKTGTAQNNKFGHKYDHSIFIGFAPMNNPKIAIAVFVEYGGWGGSAAAPVAALIAERYLKRKTEATKLDEHVKKQYLLPPVSMLPGYKGPKKAPQIRKPEPVQKDTGRKVEKLKPMMASNSGE
ncbi:peptidoglycan glycosyltransferase [Rudanella paleaurantiibacter]|uniref:Peptidoglycan glycosyltransferase n=1 Tax=Rudanella paleaurantiibacter TaxID=2614655 RepID=A0A7J5TTH9_9BACT|nr:penicillin-binding transpeptidase domain-containing protein [Rudanella paleaurantiibacter]KAB7727054.1 peptidoglycan glycosyltransferase [Rudanella paleaurantiibacter]